MGKESPNLLSEINIQCLRQWDRTSFRLGLDRDCIQFALSCWRTMFFFIVKVFAFKTHNSFFLVFNSWISYWKIYSKSAHSGVHICFILILLLYISKSCKRSLGLLSRNSYNIYLSTMPTGTWSRSRNQIWLGRSVVCWQGGELYAASVYHDVFSMFFDVLVVDWDYEKIFHAVLGVQALWDGGQLKKQRLGQLIREVRTSNREILCTSSN